MGAKGNPAVSDPDRSDGKRPVKRHRKRLIVRYGAETPSATGFTANFAEGGLYIQAVNVRPAGTLLQLEIEIPDATLALRAKVIWAKRPLAGSARGTGSGMGVQILDPTPEWVAFCEANSGSG